MPITLHRTSGRGLKSTEFVQARNWGQDDSICRPATAEGRDLLEPRQLDQLGWNHDLAVPGDGEHDPLHGVVTSATDVCRQVLP